MHNTNFVFYIYVPTPSNCSLYLCVNLNFSNIFLRKINFSNIFPSNRLKYYSSFTALGVFGSVKFVHSSTFSEQGVILLVLRFTVTEAL
jgi:hypothetical protein